MQPPHSPLCRKAILMLVERIERLPNGKSFWRSLPDKGKHAPQHVMRRWVRIVQGVLWPTELRHILLATCLTHDGVPDDRGMALYRWLLKHWYGGQAQQLHKEWYYLQQVAVTTQHKQHTPKDIVATTPSPGSFPSL